MSVQTSAPSRRGALKASAAAFAAALATPALAFGSSKSQDPVVALCRRYIVLKEVLEQKEAASCVFRRMPAGHSDAKQPVIPTEASR